ncbi:unnamed protein product [Penicillium salamii]|uniref:Uncharacterized protein n=1 Tax=Penicillium salamii TaxID=1612424 RepID=A0A9W4JXM6_9EURO|nr:unnamed protein product [Penicillium salamii]
MGCTFHLLFFYPIPLPALALHPYPLPLCPLPFTIYPLDFRLYPLPVPLTCLVPSPFPCLVNCMAHHTQSTPHTSHPMSTMVSGVLTCLVQPCLTNLASLGLPYQQKHNTIPSMGPSASDTGHSDSPSSASSLTSSAFAPIPP